MHDRTNALNTYVIVNREKWLKTCGINLNQTTRVRVTYDGSNYCRYREVSLVDGGAGMQNADNQPADALITTQPGLALFLPIADCVATTIFDEENGVLMLTHLGRQSLEQQGGLKSVQHLQQYYGSKPEKLKIRLSPTVNKDVYPIFKLGNRGMKEALYEQLEKAGVDLANVSDNDDDTATNPNYYSYSEFSKGHKPEDGCYAMVAMIPTH